MKKIHVTIVASAEEGYPACADILADCKEIRVMARPAGLHDPAAWSAISYSDVLVFDEATLERQGTTVLGTVRHHHPMIKLLLIIDNYDENKVLDALALGFTGIIERAALLSMVRKAIPVLCTGETWVSRRLVHALRTQLIRLDSDMLPGVPVLTPATTETHR